MNARQRKKLIELALPLTAINEASAKEKSIRQGHPSTLHLWWARRPLAACRAVLFAQLVDDPSSVPEEFPDDASQEAERERLFEIIKRLVPWKNSNDEHVLADARREVARSIARSRGDPSPSDVMVDAYLAANAPPVVDPFCGGGSIPLEAQRLGLRVYASDLNPVAVLITRSLVEIPQRFSRRWPVNPEVDDHLRRVVWRGASGLAEDILYYGKKLREAARARVGGLYPDVRVTAEMADECDFLRGHVDKTYPVIGWLWARTVRCKSPACGASVPMVGQHWLSKRAKHTAWLQPVVNRNARAVAFRPVYGDDGPPPTNKVGGRRVGFRCLVCSEVADSAYLASQGVDGNIGSQLLAVIADGPQGRLYLPPSEEHERVARNAEPDWRPDFKLPDYSQALPTAPYGAITWADLFSNRQLTALNTFAGLVAAIREQVINDFDACRDEPSDCRRLADGGMGAVAYGDAIAIYLGLVVGKLANRSCAFCFWHSGRETIEQPFAQQGMNKTWDYCEANPFSDKTGGWLTQLTYTAKVIANSPERCQPANVRQADVVAEDLGLPESGAILSCDPPYYTNIGYSDLSDFFYLWHRRALRSVFPNWYATSLTPKQPELVAAAWRHGGKQEATEFFQRGMAAAFAKLRPLHAPEYPAAVYYSKKQEEFGKGGVASTGWEVMLDGLLGAGMIVERTWPVKAEHTAALKKAKGALERATVLACAPRASDAASTTRREFAANLKRELPPMLIGLQGENIAPVDFAQSAIGPGMAVFSRYANVFESDGTPTSVRQALVEINRVVDEVDAQVVGEVDTDTRFCVAWFEQYGMDSRPYGEAEVLFTAKNTSFEGLERAGVLIGGDGKVRLRRRSELDPAWDPATDRRLIDWECVQHLVRALTEETGGGVEEAARLARAMGPTRADTARTLAYRLHAIAEREAWSDDALAFNFLVASWPQLQSRLAELRQGEQTQLPV